MPQIVEVRFKGIRRDFFRWSDGQEPLRLSEPVIVECERGLDFGRVHTAGAQAERKCGGACSGCELGTAEQTPLVASGEAEPAPVAEPAVADAPDAPAPSAAPSSRLAGLRAVLRRASQEEIRIANDLRRAEEEIGRAHV